MAPKPRRPRDLVAADRGRDRLAALVFFRRSSIRSRARSLPTPPPRESTVAPAFPGSVNEPQPPSHGVRMGCGYAILAPRMPGPNVEVVALRRAPPAAEPALPGLPGGAGGGPALPARRGPRPGRASRRARPSGRFGFERPMPAVAEALARQQEARGAQSERPSARAPSPPPAPPRSSPASRPASSAVRSSSSGRPSATVRVARLLEERRGQPVVPVFWVASDDHDFAEIRSTSLIDAAGAHPDPALRPAPRAGRAAGVGDRPRRHDRGARRRARRGPASRRLGRDEILALVAECYRPGRDDLGGVRAPRLARAPGDRRARPRGRGPEAPDGPGPGARARRGLAHLAARPRGRPGAPRGGLPPAGAGARGFPEPLRGGRRAAPGARPRRRASSRCAARASGGRSTTRSRRLEADPSAWSPGALLRPLVQDALLPTAAYVGGPAEIAYHAQITPSYAHFGIPRPVLLPRPSLTLVEPPQARALDAERLTLADLVGDPEALVSRWAREDYPDVEAAFARAREAIERELGGVEEALGAHDPTLRAATASARGRALHQVEGLHEKALRALKKRDQGRAERLRRTRDALLPGRRRCRSGGSGSWAPWAGTACRPSPTSRRSSTPSPAATRWCGGEDRDRLLPDGRRVGGGRGRARQAARPPGPRHPRHLVPPALPPRRLPAEHLLPRGGRLELPPLRVPAARPRPRGEDGGGDPRARPRALPRPLRDPPRHRRVPRPADARGRAPRGW